VAASNLAWVTPASFDPFYENAPQVPNRFFCLCIDPGLRSVFCPRQDCDRKSEQLFDDYWKTKQAKAAFDDQKADLEKEGKSMMAEFKKNEADYKSLLAASNDQAISDSERDKKSGTRKTS